jgi:large subunit ribosomal protein LP0
MIRQTLRGKGVVLMGKNTMVRRALRVILPEFPQFEKLMPHVRGNIGFVFTSSDLKDIREIIVSNKVAAPARAGAVAPNDVYVPGGNTGMEPGKTSFFQALGIPTKIARGTIEIVGDVQVVKAGTKVGTSEATLLNMLNISPFTYGMTVVQVYDNGAVFPPEILDIEEKTLLDGFMSGVKTIAAISLAINFPTIASVTHSLVNSYKNLLAVSLATDYEFEGSAKVSFGFIWLLFTLRMLQFFTHFVMSTDFEHKLYLTDSFYLLSLLVSGAQLTFQLKEYLANPDAFAAAAPAAEESAPAAGGDAPAAAKEEEEKEESDDDMVRVLSVACGPS